MKISQRVKGVFEQQTSEQLEVYVTPNPSECEGSIGSVCRPSWFESTVRLRAVRNMAAGQTRYNIQYSFKPELARTFETLSSFHPPASRISVLEMAALT